MKIKPFDIDSKVLIVGLGLLGGSYAKSLSKKGFHVSAIDTRIARINDAMWSELFMLNKEALIQQMNLFISNFTELRDLIANGQVEELRDKMKLSTQRRALFDRK